jgi:HSP20 family protein
MKPCKLPATHSLFPKTVDDLFNQFWGAEPRRGSFNPNIDVTETIDAFLVRAELPGVDADDVEVTVGPDSLTLKGEKKADIGPDDAKGHISERAYGPFQRSFTFRSAISTDDVLAEYKKGVLHVTLKKAQSEKVRKIEIRGE